nr:hypothetical protein [uncultured Roseateles sp.]
MTGDTYPIANSLAARVCGELMGKKIGTYLTIIDLAERYELRSNEVTPLLMGAVQHGWLRREHGAGDRSHLGAFAAGPALIEMAERAAKAVAAAPAPAPAPAPTITHERPPILFCSTGPDPVVTVGPAPAPETPAEPPAKRRNPRLPPLDPAKLVVEYDKPVVPHTGNGTTSYAPVFAKLDRVGASTAAELRYMAALKQAAKHYVQHHAPSAKFAVRVDPEDAAKCRVHRLA